jgi:antitoxin component HigA of HigAB toxin-antitoxin module
MDIAPIKSQRDYRCVLKEIEGLMSARRNTPAGDRLDVLVTYMIRKLHEGLGIPAESLIKLGQHKAA